MLKAGFLYNAKLNKIFRTVVDKEYYSHTNPYYKLRCVTFSLDINTEPLKQSSRTTIRYLVVLLPVNPVKKSKRHFTLFPFSPLGIK